MTADVRGPAAGSARNRPRPRVHFTAEEGWINDAYGITWLGDRYRMFYQAIPQRTTWAEGCNWGAAESPDLVRWRELPLALEPQDFELGCWSGTAVLDAEPPRLFYTRITEANWAKGSIATATGDAALESWTTDVGDVVVPGPPRGLGVTTFRDPFVFRHGEDWVMIVGAGMQDGSGAAVQFRSRDLVSWECDGLLSHRASNGVGVGVGTGQVWECPQFFPLDDEWVLLVSVWEDDELHYVAAAVGEYDGRHFAPRSWQRLTYGSSAYAMTAFTDRDGRRCVLSWLREEPRNDPGRVGWVGALSVAALVSRGPNGQLVLSPHPDLAALATPGPRPPAADGAGESRLLLESGAAQVTLFPVPGSAVAVFADAGQLLRVEFGDGRGTVSRPNLRAEQLPVDPTQPLVVLVDADIVEIFGPAGYGAYRVGTATDPSTTELVFSSTHPEVPVPAAIEEFAWHRPTYNHSRPDSAVLSAGAACSDS